MVLVKRLNLDLDGDGNIESGALGNSADSGIKVSSDDTTPSFLETKLVQGSNITLTVQNPGANENILITASGAAIGTDELVKVSANDTTEGYLNGKLVQGTNITLTENNDGGNETLTISASGGATNLTIGSQTATTLDIESSTGTNATVPAATISLAGLLTGADKTKLDTVETNAAADQNASEVPYTGAAPTNYTPGAATVEGHLTGIDSALGSVAGATIITQDEGIQIDPLATTLNFVGAGVTATDAGSNVTTITIPGGGSSLTVQDEGVSLSTAATLFNFVGNGVEATEPVADQITVTVNRFNHSETTSGTDISITAGNAPYQFISASSAINVDIDDTTVDSYYRIRSTNGANVITLRDETDTQIFLLGNAVDNGNGVETRLLAECYRTATNLVCDLL